jgi:predicted permease
LHVEMETENNIRLGMSPVEARRRALVVFGGVEHTKEQVRDERHTRWLEQLAADLRFALRGFRMRPGFTFGVVTLIALGVGVNTGIFSVMNHVLLYPLPYADGNRMVEFTAQAGGGTVMITPMQEQVDQWRARGRAVQDIIVFRWNDYQLGDSTKGPTETLHGALITPGAVAFTGAKPLLGRDISAQDTLSDAPPVALIAHSLWQSRFGGNGSIVGQSILLDGTPHTVIGILPPKFKLPFVDGDQIFSALRSSGGNRPIDAMAKLRPGASVEQANRELTSIFTTLDKRVGQDPPRVMRAADWVSKSTKRVVYIMFVAVFIVLAIACANVANLLLSRAWSRRREFAIRAAMGAGRPRLIRQMFTESMLLSIVGGVAGIGIAFVTLKTILAVQPGLSGDFDGTRIEPHVFLWALGLSLLTGILFGLAPAMFVAGERADDALKSGTPTAPGSKTARHVRGALVVAEVALSAVLLVASGLMVRTIVAMQRANYGIQPAGLWGVHLNISDKQIGDSIARQGVAQAILQRVRAVPGVQGATYSTSLPPHFATGMGEMEIEGRPVSSNDSLRAISMLMVRPELFSLAGIRILQGRAFADDRSARDFMQKNTEVVVNESFAKRFWPNGDALGKKVRRGGGPWATIVGVAADVHVPGDTRVLKKTQFYQALAGAPTRATLVVRSIAPMNVMLPSIEAAVAEASPRVKVDKPESSEMFLTAARSMHKFTLTLIGAFAALALLLAAFGLHAVIAYSVGQRAREIGIRVALGAQSSDVMQMVIAQGMRLAVVGIAFGAVGGYITAGAMRAMLYDVAPSDPLTLGATMATLALVALVASYMPARRALRVDPVDALRSE